MKNNSNNVACINGRYSVQPGKKVWVMDSPDLMMLDWDVCDDGNIDNHFTVSSKDEALSLIKRFCKKNPLCLFRVYETPNGVHSFLLSHRVAADSPWATRIGLAMRADQYYLTMCRRRGLWSYRVEPKAGREGDYVARFMCWVGSGVADPYLAKLMKKHDDLIRLGLRGKLKPEGDQQIVTYKNLVE